MPLLLAAFTVGRPQPLPPPALPPAFDATTAGQLARELARDYPDRSPGSSGALAATDWVRQQFALYGFKPQIERFTALIPGRGQVELGNIVAIVRGSTQRTIVVTAHRDNSGEGHGANDNASGTGALIELARAYAPASGTTTVQTRPTHTLVFVSTDGGEFGGAWRSPVRRDLAVRQGGGRGDQPRRDRGAGAAATPDRRRHRPLPGRVARSHRDGAGARGERGAARVAGALRQLLDLGFPFTLGEQGPFVARGIPALTLTTVTERPARAVRRRPSAPATAGRARPGGAEPGRLARRRRRTRAGCVELRLHRNPLRPRLGDRARAAGCAAALPIGAIDLFARCRRRRIPLAPALRSLRSRLLFWGYVGVLLFAAAKLGVFGEGEPRPLPPDAPGLGARPRSRQACSARCSSPAGS